MPNSTSKSLLTLQESIDLFGALLTSARELIGGRERIESFAGHEEEIPKFTSWAFLFRLLNFGDAALLCAQNFHAEAVACIARSIWEINVITKCMASDAAFAESRRHFCTKKSFRETKDMYQYLAGQTTPNAAQLKELEDAKMQMRAELSEVNERKFSWEALAQKAGMREDYLFHYAVLCRDAHHREQALSLYLRRARDGVELHQNYQEINITVFLNMAIKYWCGAMDLLLRECGIGLSEAYVGAQQKILNALRNTR